MEVQIIVSIIIAIVLFGLIFFKKIEEFIRKGLIWREYKQERILYKVEPTEKYALAWECIGAEHEQSRPKKLTLKEIQKHEIVVASLLRTQGYWKVYIIDKKNIEVLFVKTAELNMVKEIKRWKA